MSGPFSFCNESEPSVAIIFLRSFSVPPSLFLRRHPILAGAAADLSFSSRISSTFLFTRRPSLPIVLFLVSITIAPMFGLRSLSKLITATKLKVVVLLLLNRWICSCCSRMDDSQQYECREQTMDHYRGVHFLVKELNALKVLEANIPILESNIPTFGFTVYCYVSSDSPEIHFT
ncbi:hypothetical protein K1719_038934 [Acacia pycnantha]|nr:hypothetical protein K1719_038934 [Acacia pycnantha]